MARFVDVEAWLAGQLLRQRIVSALQTGTGLGDQFGEITTADFDLQHVTDEFANGGIRAMAGALEISDHRREPRTDQAGSSRRGVDGSIVDLLALAAPASLRAELDHADQFRGQGQFHVLNNFGRQFAGHDGTMTIRALREQVFEALIDLIGRQERPLVTRVLGLSAAFAFFPVRRFVLGFFDDVARRRLGGVGGVLFGCCEFRLQLRNLGLELFKLLFQNGASCARVRPCGRHDAI